MFGNIPKDVIERYRMKFLNDTRGCVTNKEIPELVIAGQKIGPYQVGVRVDLPNWVIENLVNQSLVEIEPDDDYESLRNLQGLYRNEKDQPHKLQTFHPLLYAALSRKMLCYQRDKTSLDPESYDEIEKMQIMIRFLVETRVSKIWRVAKSGAYVDKKKQMTNEERWLCEALIELISSWRKNVIE